MQQYLKRAGFTLIELLIVIAVIGLLAVALLSAINPAEQLRKTRDATRKSDASELLSALERYYTTYNCYPWARNASGQCTTVTKPSGAYPNFSSISGSGSALAGLSGLLASSELKTQFATRNTVVNRQLFITENTAESVSVCFVPESSTAREMGLGQLKDLYNATDVATGSCTAAASYNASSTTFGCYVCVPQ